MVNYNYLMHFSGAHTFISAVLLLGRHANYQQLRMPLHIIRYREYS